MLQKEVTKMTKQERNTIEAIAWQQLRNCKFYKMQLDEKLKEGH